MRRILLVDDEIIIATQLEERLTQMGYEIVGIAASGLEAVYMAKKLVPDLVLMDIVMPGEVDGIEAARLIQEENRIPFIFVTAHTDQDLIRRATEQEPVGYILKPFQDGQITAAIEIALHNEEMAGRLRQSEKRYRKLVEIIPHGIIEIDMDLNIVFANPALYRMLEYPEGELTGTPVTGIMQKKADKEKIHRGLLRVLEDEPPPTPWIFRERTRRGRVINLEVSWDYKRDAGERVTGLIAVVTDITERLDFEAALRRAHDELEKRVEHRTRELVRVNTRLEKEIQDRKRAEEALEIKQVNLEETNTALKVLLKKRDEYRLEMEEKVLINMKELAFPYLEKLGKTVLAPTQRAYLEILESNLDDIISPFSRRLSSRLWNFTPAEIKIANLIRQGKTTKEIAALLNLSPKTVETHRKNIRKKLSIDGRKANLRSHLLSIQ